MDELKKLARAWNLNEKRNFWKSHLSKSDITAALLQYIQDVSESKFISKALYSYILDNNRITLLLGNPIEAIVSLLLRSTANLRKICP